MRERELKYVLRRCYQRCSTANTFVIVVVNNYGKRSIETTVEDSEGVVLTVVLV